MVTRRALLSVSDKRGLPAFAQGLSAHGFELVSTGGTAQILRDAGLPVTSVESVTGFPEILDGRVKTLHPHIHGGLLARRQHPGHMAELQALGIMPIELLVVNLYPFEATAARAGVSLEELVEQIDIGGVALLRAGAKNYESVTVICDPDDYEVVLSDLQQYGEVPLGRRQRLALKAFRHTAGYDAAIASALALRFGEPELFPERFPLSLKRISLLRYGENPHQAAALYGLGGNSLPLGGHQLQGKELSYNNILDLDAAWRAASDFDEPAAAIIKHTNPCGLAVRTTLAEAFRAALACDPVSAFGGIIAVNRPVDAETVQAMGDLFVEAIIAPAFTPAALETLTSRPNCRLIAADISQPVEDRFEMRAVRGGLLVQTRDEGWEGEEWRVVSRRQPTPEEWADLRFAWKVAKHVKSNSIVFAKGRATVGIGAGQMSRVDSVRIAGIKAGQRARGSVVASDAFFPFADGLRLAAEAGATAAIEPGG
ncbi:MAG: bifunctional phosphoribosylaminoimidazolecarboxamide formyltransferase/IMP cyclohydrolase, partial [Anaerolineae bacterium]